MKYVPVVRLLVAGAVLLLGMSVGVSAEVPPIYRIVRPFYLPIICGSGLVEIRKVEVVPNGSPMNSYAEVMSGPVYAAAVLPEDYKRDINLISASKIKIHFKYLNDDDPHPASTEMDMFIDVSGFQQPSTTNLQLFDILQMILVAFRMEFPPSFIAAVNVKITGAKEPAKFSKLEGRLWTSESLKSDEK